MLNTKSGVMSIFTSKGCVAKCTFCQRGAKGYSGYDLSKLEAYIKDKKLPIEFDYFDPVKALENRECGIHLKH